MTPSNHHHRSSHYLDTLAALKERYKALSERIRAHRTSSSSRAARDLHLVRCFLRNRTYRQCEATTRQPYYPPTANDWLKLGEEPIYGCAALEEFKAWVKDGHVTLQSIREQGAMEQAA